ARSASGLDDVAAVSAARAGASLPGAVGPVGRGLGASARAFASALWARTDETEPARAWSAITAIASGLVARAALGGSCFAMCSSLVADARGAAPVALDGSGAR